jgi:hypothetical protein
MTPHRQLLQRLDKVAAVATLLCQPQVLADLSVLFSETVASVIFAPAAFKCIKTFAKVQPCVLMVLFELALFHIDPAKPRAMPFSWSTAC